MTTATTTTPGATDLETVLSVRDRPRPAGAASVSLTFGWRTLLRIRHDPQQLFDAVAFPIMFTLMFTYLFGGALAGSTGEYLEYFLPGVMVFTVVMLTMYAGVALNADVSRGVTDRFRSMPLWRPGILVGAMLGSLVRYATGSLVVVGLGLALGYRPGGGVGGVLASILLLLGFALAMSWVFTALGLLLRTPEAVMGAGPVVLFPYVFASNLFVDPRTMPGWLRAIVEVNPFTHAVTAVRGLLDGTAGSGEIGWVLVSSALVVAVFAPLTVRLHNAGPRS
jgi:ABC-2 type transport system permease protein